MLFNWHLFYLLFSPLITLYVGGLTYLSHILVCDMLVHLWTATKSPIAWSGLMMLSDCMVGWL